MAIDSWNILITANPLEPPPLAFSSEEGAVIDFLGVVRGTEAGAVISGIDYEAHVEMAEHQLRRIADEAREQFGIGALVLHHRVGFVAAGEPSLFLRVTGRHRGPAFAASQWIIERLKERVPIWKRPVQNTRIAPAGDATGGDRGLRKLPPVAGTKASA